MNLYFKMRNELYSSVYNKISMLRLLSFKIQDVI